MQWPKKVAPIAAPRAYTGPIEEADMNDCSAGSAAKSGAVTIAAPARHGSAQPAFYFPQRA
jgi:hypothetical protein